MPQETLHQTMNFLRALDPDAETFLFVTINEDGKTHSARRPVIDKLLRSLTVWNEKEGENVFFTVNEMNSGEGISRKKEDVTKFRCVFLDDDNKKEAKPYPIPPSAIIESSPGKKQVYWFITGAQPSKSEWDKVQQTMVNDYGGDKNARDAARILRLPGFRNCKYKEQPLCRIRELNTRRYTWAEIVKHFPPSEVLRATGQPLGRPLDLGLTLEQFITGDNYHNAGISLAGYYYYHGITDRDKLILTLQGLMDVQGDPNDRRFDQRRNVDIPGSVDWILKERAKEKTIDTPPPEIRVQEGEKYTRLEWPVGFAGILARDIWKFMVYKNKTIAVSAAWFILATLSGRKDSFMNNAPAIKLVLLGPTATGKDTARKYMDNIIGEMFLYGKGELPPKVIYSFRTVSSSYGVSAILKEAVKCVSMGFISSESGIGGKTRSGDPESLKAFKMQNQMQDAYGTLTANLFAEGFPDIYGVCISELKESTNEAYLHNFKSTDTHATGEAGREFKIKIDHRPDNDTTKYSEIPKEIKKGICALMVEAARGENFEATTKVGRKEYVGPALVPVDFLKRRPFSADEKTETRLEEMLAEEIKRRNQTADDDAGNMEWAQQSRYRQQCIRLALILARTDCVVNGTEDTVVAWEHLEYAEKAIQEIHRAERANRDDYGDEQEQLMESMYKFSVKILETPTKEYLRLHSSAERKENKFRRSMFLKANTPVKKVVKRMNDYKSDQEHILAAIKMGVGVGYWKFFDKTVSGGVEYLEINFKK